MAVYVPSKNQFYLPPQPITKILSTDQYVQRTSVFFHAASERLLTVGHPFYEIKQNDELKVPKVSPNQFRVFRVKFPNPNQFAFENKSLFNPETERLVWALRGMEIGRGQPLGLAISGNVLFNKFEDIENPLAYDQDYKTANKDDRKNLGFDPKQNQLFIVGCKPALGEYWTKAEFCKDDNYDNSYCPALKLENAVIEDGTMTDVGLGALDFPKLQPNKSDAPMDVSNSISMYPDYLQMAEDTFGDRMWFYARREQLYARHMISRAGDEGKETVDESLYFKSELKNNLIATANYSALPSGSLLSSEAQLFNRPYWLQRSSGQNNGIMWKNELFVTVADNTRGTFLAINTLKNDAGDDLKNGDFYEFTRHVEEYQLSFIIQLCKVHLSPENLAYIHTMDPQIIEDWHLAVNPPPSSLLEDHYRYITSRATKCPAEVTPTDKKDPYAEYKFWEVDLSERLTEQLDQTSLGRRFLFQSGATSSTSYSSRKRTRSGSRSYVTTKRVVKKRRT